MGGTKNENETKNENRRNRNQNEEPFLVRAHFFKFSTFLENERNLPRLPVNEPVVVPEREVHHVGSRSHRDHTARFSIRAAAEMETCAD